MPGPAARFEKFPGAICQAAVRLGGVVSPPRRLSLTHPTGLSPVITPLLRSLVPSASRIALSALLACLLASLATAGDALRIAAYNVKGLNRPGVEYDALVDTLQRLDADIVLLQEVSGATDVADLPFLAADTGYAFSVASSFSGTLSGGLRTGVLSRVPITGAISWSAAALSGDPAANDITRDIFEVTLDVPDVCNPLVVFPVHFKASSGSGNRFRRAVEQRRLRSRIEAVKLADPSTLIVVGGDFNDALDDTFGSTFTSVPSGLPGSFSLGTDITFPVVHDPFVQLAGDGLVRAEATHEDSATDTGTLIVSGNSVDHIFVSAEALLMGDEIYSSEDDDGLDGGPIGLVLHKSGSPLDGTTSFTASDHYPVFSDWLFAGCSGTPFGVSSPGTYALEPRATIGGTPAIGSSDFVLRGVNVLPGAPTFLILGTGALIPGVDLAPQLPDTTLHVDLGTMLSLFPSSADASGTTEFAFPLPNKPSIVGIHIVSQWLVVDSGAPNGLGALSDGFDVTIE